MEEQTEEEKINKLVKELWKVSIDRELAKLNIKQ